MFVYVIEINTSLEIQKLGLEYSGKSERDWWIDDVINESMKLPKDSLIYGSRN